ncbi:gluconolactonase [Nitzschia inconspicua]|uniref:Gluconolactonase n=1 Tax=Nitzschia inconspicua TaxID=303405 RepID=A0A9K3KDU0_9STRA|nr:gluconolactonase [Nitzschia inconspicua]
MTTNVSNMTIYLARHGQDEDNANGILNGRRRDTPLTIRGKQQAQALSDKIRQFGLQFDAVYSSPLQRARMTAEIAVAASNISSIDIVEELSEREFGVMTGVPIAEIADRCGDDDILTTENVTYFLSPEGAETFPELMERAQRVLDYLQERHVTQKDGATILLVTHGDFGKMFYANFYKLDWRDVLTSFHFDNSDLILCSSKVPSPPKMSDTHIFRSCTAPTTALPKVFWNPTPLVNLQSFLDGPPATLNDDGVSVTAQLIVDSRCHLGECVIYDDRRDAILFTSILERRFHKLDLNTSNGGDSPLQSFDLPKMLCAFGLLDQQDVGYIVAWDDGFQLYDLEGGKPLSPMSDGEVVNRLGLPDRLNDGRVDPTGRRFVCGGCAGSNDPLKVYQCDYDPSSKTLRHRPIVGEIRTTNSICWSNDGKTMYLADSPTRRIDRYDYDLETGLLSNRRELHRKDHGDPDGSVVDAQGFLWNATWRQGKGTGMVDRIDPETGEVVFTVHLPDETSEASCCCFGGPKLDILFITTAWENLDSQSEPHAGGLYAVKLPTGMSGCPEKRFKL